MNKLILLACLMYGTYGHSQIDSVKVNKKLKPIISMEIESFSISYAAPKSSSKRSPSYRSSSIFYYYQPIYKNWGLVPIIGYNYYYYYDKFVTGDKYQTKGLYYGLGLEKRFKINENSNFGVGIQKIYEALQIENSMYPTKKYFPEVWRFRLTGSTQLYRRFGLTTSLNFVAYPKSANPNLYILGHYRDINFSFGVTYTFNEKMKK